MAKLNTSTIIVVAQLLLMINSVAGLPAGTSSTSESGINESQPRPGGIKGFASKASKAGSAAWGHTKKAVEENGGKRATAKRVAGTVHGTIQDHGGYVAVGRKGWNLYNDDRGLPLALHGKIMEHGGYKEVGRKGWGRYKAYGNNRRDLESISVLEARDAPYIYFAERDESRTAGKRDLEGRSWNHLDARGYGKMNELD